MLQSFLGIKKRVTAIISILSEWRSLLETIIGDKFPFLFAIIILLVGHTQYKIISLTSYGCNAFCSEQKNKGQQSNQVSKKQYLEAGLSKQNQYKDLIGFVSWILLDYVIRSQTILRERCIHFLLGVHASLVCHLRASSSSILKWDGA